jgi:hypothetical protein
LFANLEVGLEHLDEAVWFEHLKSDGTKIHQHPLAPQEVTEELESIREELYASLPTVHLPELMMAIASEIRFGWILLERKPANEQELLYLYAALLGHAMDLKGPAPEYDDSEPVGRRTHERAPKPGEIRRTAPRTQ